MGDNVQSVLVTQISHTVFQFQLGLKHAFLSLLDEKDQSFMSIYTSRELLCTPKKALASDADIGFSTCFCCQVLGKKRHYFPKVAMVFLHK